jgi:2'-hydroxyisoflavone reductase
MKFVILGGTRFLGHHLVEAALARDHKVTLFNRGRHETDSSPNAEIIHGDRNGGLADLSGRHWDAAIDTCGYTPRQVRAAAEILADAVNHYTFISSLSVFADFSVSGVNESAPVKTLTSEQLSEAETIDAEGNVSAATYGKMYGALKALSEQAAEETLPNRVLVVRPGLIAGSYDYTDRFTYWVVRVARGGEVLAPGNPTRFVQLIDVRDLAQWIVRMIERGQTGTYNANGRPKALTMEMMLEGCRMVTNSDAHFTWVSDRFLMKENVVPWTEMPLWLPEEEAPHMKGFMSVDCSKADAAGLTLRPLSETIEDTLTWHKRHGSNTRLQAGIKPEEEQQLLQKWHESI